METTHFKNWLPFIGKKILSMYLLSLIAATVWNMVDTVKSPVSTAPYTQAALEGKVDFYQVYYTGLCPCFQANKSILFTIFVLEWWPPNTSTMRATRQEEPAPGEYLVPGCSTFVLPHVSRCLPSAPCSLAHKLCCQQTDHSSRQTWNKDSGDILHTWSICF